MREITNTADFTAMLDATIKEIDALVVAEPDYPIWAILQQQLHYMKACSTSTEKPEAEKLNAVSIGLIAARELEPTEEAWLQDLIDRLHLLNQYWRYRATRFPSTYQSPPKATRKFFAIGLMVAAAVPALLAVLHSATQTQAGPPIPQGQTVPIAGALATLTVSLEPYTVSLHRNPERDRYSVQLQLSDPTGKQSDRFIPIARHLQARDLHFDARLLGDDGHRLWFYVKSIGAWDYLKGKLVTADDLRRANPSLGKFAGKDNSNDPLIDKSVRNRAQPAQELWAGESRLYQFEKRLQVTTPDFQRVFEIDPATLCAIAK